MTRFTLIPLALALVLGSAPLTGCDTDTPPLTAAEFTTTGPAQFCAQVASCACENYDEAACITAQRDDFDLTTAEGEKQGLTFSPECATKSLGRLKALACQTAATLSTQNIAEFRCSCRVYHGDVAEGDACEPYLEGLSNCASGLECNTKGKICVDPCVAPSNLGAACAPADGQPCGTGLACDGPSSKCVAVPALGASCTGTYICASGAYCDLTDFANAVCTAQLADGASCDGSEKCLSASCEGPSEAERTCTPGVPLVCSPL